ncbi:MAG: hypothetical protein JXQ90_02035 [Cyclobacteriaceae bacterium]
MRGIMLSMFILFFLNSVFGQFIQGNYINPASIDSYPLKYPNLIDLDTTGVPSRFINYFPYRLFTYLNGQLIGNITAEHKCSYDTCLHLYYEYVYDSSEVHYLSQFLYNSNARVLSDHFLRHEMYRFSWIRSWHDGYVFTLHLTNSPHIEVSRMSVDGTVKISHHKITLSKLKVSEFKNHLIKSNFWLYDNYNPPIGMVVNDGAEWLLEAHTSSKYKFILRNGPDLYHPDELLLRQLGQWLIYHSGMEVGPIY